MAADTTSPASGASVRLVYVGPCGSGRGTNLKALFEASRGERRGPLESSEGEPERTVGFEFAPANPVHLRGREVRFRVVAVTGSQPSPELRQAVLSSAHGVVFVADSSRSRLQDTLAAFREMARQIAARPVGSFPVPVLIQYNKRDAADALSEADLEDALNPDKLLAAIAAVATRGEGVLETFGGILLATMGILVEQNVDVDLLSGRNVETWTRGDVEGLFGRLSLSVPAAEPEPPGAPARPEDEAGATPGEAGETPADTWSEPPGPGLPVAADSEPTSPGRILYDTATEAITRRLSVVLVERALAALAAATPATTALESGPAHEAPLPVQPAVERTRPLPAPDLPPPAPVAPPQPAAAPGPRVVGPRGRPGSREADVARLRRQRDAALAESDEARFRLDDLRLAVSVARAMSRGEKTTTLLQALLARLVRRFAASSASLLAPAEGGAVRVVAGLDSDGDPLAAAPQAGRLVAGLVSRQQAPVQRDPAEQQELAQALEQAGYTAAPLVVAPLRTARGLHGVIVLYLDADAPPPEEVALTLLASVADALALGVGRAAEA